MIFVLDAITGVSWIAVYIIAIVIGIKKKASCIPWFAISMNFSWEVCAIMGRIIHNSPLKSDFIIQLLWLMLDVGVIIIWVSLNHNSRNFKTQVAVFGCVFSLVFLLTLFGDYWKSSVFVINLIMSVLFLFRTDKSVFASLSIAIMKCVGTLAATILNGFVYWNFVVISLGGLCFVADICYIIDIVRQQSSKNKVY